MKNDKIKKLLENSNIVYKKGCREARKSMINLQNDYCFCLFTLFKSQHRVKTMKTSTTPSCNRQLPAQKYVLHIILLKRIFSKHRIYVFKLSEINAINESAACLRDDQRYKYLQVIFAFSQIV